MVLALGRMRAQIVGRASRDGRTVVASSCVQVVTGNTPSGNVVTTACCVEQTLEVLRVTVKHPYLALWLYVEITYTTGGSDPDGWQATTTGPDGQTITLDLYCDSGGGNVWKFKFKWGANTLTMTASSGHCGLSSFEQVFSGSFTHAGITGTLDVTATS